MAEAVSKGGRTLINAMISSFTKVTASYSAWERALVKWEEEYETEDQDEIEATFNTVNTLLDQIEKTREFSDKIAGVLERMQTTVGFYAKNADQLRQQQQQKDRAAGINARSRRKKSTPKRSRPNRRPSCNWPVIFPTATTAMRIPAIRRWSIPAMILSVPPMQYQAIADQRDIIDPLGILDTGEVKRHLDPVCVLRRCGLSVPDGYSPHLSIDDDVQIVVSFYNAFCRNGSRPNIA
jgi:hypothetical protein